MSLNKFVSIKVFWKSQRLVYKNLQSGEMTKVETTLDFIYPPIHIVG